MKAAVPLILSATLVLGGCAVSGNMREVNLDKAAQVNAELALRYFNEGEMQLAKSKAEKAVDQSDKNALANSVNGLIQQRLGDKDKAERYLRRAVELAPDQPEYANSYGVFLCETGRMRDGVKQFVAVAENPLHRAPALAYENAATCAIKDRNYELAEEFLLLSLKEKSDYHKARFGLAELQFRDGRFAEALDNIQTLEKAGQMSAAVAAVGVRSARALKRPVVAEHYQYILQSRFPESYQARALGN
ncbi:MAG: hypothetical protein ACPGSC_08810 [Granulosicoccaceae bacterium]